MRLLQIFCVALWLGLSLMAAADEVKQIEVTASDIAYDAFSQRLFATIPSNAPAMQNSLLIIDPVTAKIEKVVYMGDSPGQIAVSDRGKYVWVALNGGAIRRFDVETRTPGPLFFLGANLRAEEIHAVPGNPEALLVVRDVTNRSPRYEGMVIIENGIVRSVAGGSNTVAFGAFGNRFYSYYNESSAFDLSVWTFTAGGLERISGGGGPIQGYGRRIRSENGLIYVDNGTVVDPEIRAVIGTFAVHSSAYVPDAAAGRMFYAIGDNNGVRIVACDLHAFAQLDTVMVPGIKGEPRQLVRWGRDGLAFLTAQAIVLLRTQSVPPPIPTVDLSVQRSSFRTPLTAGQPAVYTLTVSNLGASQATGVSLTDRLPPDIDVLDLKVSQGDITAVDGTVRVAISTLAPKKSVVAQVTIQPRKDGLIPFTAVALVRADQLDKNPQNNTILNSILTEPGHVVNPPANTVRHPPTTAPVPAAPPPVGIDLTGQWKEVDQAITGAGVDLQATITGTFIVKNIGVKPSPRCKLRFYLTSATGLEPLEELLEEDIVPPLAPGKSFTSVLKARLPKGRSAIGQTITAEVDATKVVKDVNRDNNLVRSKPLP